MTTRPVEFQPPRAAAWLVGVCASPDESDAVLGDLREEFVDVAGREGVAAARRWYWRQALRSSGHLTFGPFRQRPWRMAGAGVLALLPTWPLAWLTKVAAEALVVRVDVYDVVSAAAFWQMAGLLPLFVAGVFVGWAARRPMTAAVAMLVMMLVLVSVVDPILMAFVYPRPSRTVAFWAWRSTVVLSVWAAPVLLGAIVGRKTRPRSRPRSIVPAA